MTEARALILDIGGVVLRNAPDLIRDWADRDGDRTEPVVPVVAGPEDDRWQAMLRHEITEREYWSDRAADIGSLLGHDGWTTRELMTWLYHDPLAEIVNPEVVELMVDARAAGIPVVALTNDLVDFHGQQWTDEQEWLRNFDVIVDGSVTGVLKPDPQAYRMALGEVGVPASETVYLDDMPVNVRGGLDAGLQAIEVQYDDHLAAVGEARRRLGLDS